MDEAVELSVIITIHKLHYMAVAIQSETHESTGEAYVCWRDIRNTMFCLLVAFAVSLFSFLIIRLLSAESGERARKCKNLNHPLMQIAFNDIQPRDDGWMAKIKFIEKKVTLRYQLYAVPQNYEEEKIMKKFNCKINFLSCCCCWCVETLTFAINMMGFGIYAFNPRWKLWTC